MAKTQPHICMLAAENDALPGGKVGGIGDVVRDLPPALAATGATVTVITPSYGAFHRLSGSTKMASVSAGFMGRDQIIDVYSVEHGSAPGVQQIVLEQPLFSACGAGNIYCNDGSDRPFATDASKFALFSTAALSLLCADVLEPAHVIHLHDWHAAFAAVLRFYDPKYAALKPIPTVLSIHNLAMQGIRPLTGDASSWQNWYNDLIIPPESVVDPRWGNCGNPLAAAIRLSDKVHTVSPTYALEILRPNDPSRGFHGGEGLEADLQAAEAEHRLVGILNGTDYPAADAKTPRVSRDARWKANLKSLRELTLSWLGESEPMPAVHYLAHHRTVTWLEESTPKHIVTSVGRLTDQKMAIALHTLTDGRTVLEHLLTELQENDGVFILLGSGDPKLEAQCQRIAANYANCLFLNRYAASVADALFELGDLFFMPSSFEPCGISQLVAMRFGQPCLVHAVGGLKDTIIDDVDGFQFAGESPSEQAEACVKRFNDAIMLHTTNSAAWKKMQKAAKSRRFTWSASAEQYREHLYRDAQ